MTLIHIDKNTLGAYDKENKKLVVVAVNTKGKSRKAELDLSDFLTVGAEAEVIVTSGNTVGGKKWHEEGKLRVENKIFRANLEPNCVTTFIIENTLI